MLSVAYTAMQGGAGSHLTTDHYTQALLALTPCLQLGSRYVRSGKAPLQSVFISVFILCLRPMHRAGALSVTVNPKVQLSSTTPSPTIVENRTHLLPILR